MTNEKPFTENKPFTDDQPIITGLDTGELEKWMSEEEAHQLLAGTSEQLEEAAKALEKVRIDLALEVGRNEKWQSMFEELAQAAVTIAGWTKRVYLTKHVNLEELQAVYLLSDRIEHLMLAYQQRRDKVDGGQVARETILDSINEKPLETLRHLNEEVEKGSQEQGKGNQEHQGRDKGDEQKD